MKYNTSHNNQHQEVNEEAMVYNAIENRNAFSLINLIRSGIRFTMFKSIADKSSFSFAEWSDFLHLSERTMQRYQKEKKSFDPIYSEKIIEITMLYNYGKEVFGDKKNFDHWLQTENIALGKRTPKELLDSTFGIRLVKDELTRIEHGVLA